MSAKKSVVNEAKTMLREKFKLEDLGQLNYYLGIKFERRGNAMVLSQRA